VLLEFNITSFVAIEIFHLLILIHYRRPASLPSAGVFAEGQKSGTRQIMALGKNSFAECSTLGKYRHSTKTALPSAGVFAEGQKSGTRQIMALGKNSFAE
jgi:hypothetical protein